jgi:MtrB/PioB family decaheme-associated outer membrane protein
MRRRLFGCVLCLAVLGLATVANAQVSVSLEPVGGVQAQQPQPATPPEGQPTPAPEAQSAPAAGPVDASRSLFEPSWNMFQFAGRLSSVAGDEARFQRYQDLRDGPLFTDARFLRETSAWSFQAGADNLGWRDQRYFAVYERVGRFTASGLFDQIPQFYSIDTRTPFASAGEGVLVLDDAVQGAIQAKETTLNAYIPISPQFDLREKRNIGSVQLSATPTEHLDVTGGFTTTNHTGELPWGASFGFGNDNEVALPYRSRTNDLDVGVEWVSTRAMIRAAYDASWFDNQDDTLLWDNPLQLTDTTTAPGHGRMALWPANSRQTLSTAGYAKFAHRTQLSGSVAFGWWNNDEPLLPFTVNTALPQLALPRTDSDASAHTIATNLNVVSRPLDEWRFSARFRRYDYNNETAHAAIPEFVNYDTSLTTSATGGPELFAHATNTLDAEATWTRLHPVALTVGYINNHNNHDFRTFGSTNENILKLEADAVGSAWVSFRAHYEHGARSGSDLDEASLIQIGEQPLLRHFDIANRTRDRFTGQVDVTPNEAVTLSLSAGLGSDDYDDSYFGLQSADFRNVTAAVDYALSAGWTVGGSYDYERYEGGQQSRSASPGPQAEDPNRDWTVDTNEHVHYFSIYLNPKRFGNTETRFSYDYAYARGHYIYEVGPALPPPSQLPTVFNKLQDFRADVRHRLSGRLALTLSYLYEPYRIFDFAFDPSVINSIVQPSSLVLGYTYRPYTAHSAVFGVLYYW